jgi:hypothetical protein
MDHAILSATAALVGSLVGGVSTFAAYWLTQRVQIRNQRLMQQAVTRETLYAEFIVEAARRLADAWSHHADGPEVVSSLYSAIQRMRLTSSSAVSGAAERVLNDVLDAYAEPDRSFDDLRITIRDSNHRDRLGDFSEACRKELLGLVDGY